MNEDEDTHPERPRPRPTSVRAVEVIEQELNAPAEFALGSRPALDIETVGAEISPAGPSPREPFVVACDLGGKHFAVETDGVAVSLVLLKAMRIVATPDEAVTLAKALLRAVSLVRR